MAEYSEEIPAKVACALLNVCANELEVMGIGPESRDKLRIIIRTLRTLTLAGDDPVRKAFYDGRFRNWRDLEATFNDMERLIKVGETLDIEGKHRRKERNNETNQS